ncbi:MAG: PD-(D/E)XK nuclease family protein [archaeon]
MEKKKPIYSHSRLSTFEQCPFKFKLRYIDKIIPEIEQSIESLLGSCVHETFEWLYTQLKEKNIPTLDEIIIHYSELWQEKFNGNILIVKNHLSEKDYFNKGVQFIVNYYTKHHPFDDNTLELEKKILLALDEDGEYKIQGFIDRLVYNLKTKEYEVHDYKTAKYLPRQEKFDADRQLALYSIAIKELFGHDKEVCLVWHYLAHNKKICSRRTNKQLEQLKTETLELIKQIEATQKFPPYITKLCDWCEYKTMCPAWGNSPEGKEIENQVEEEEEIENKNELDIW